MCTDQQATHAQMGGRARTPLDRHALFPACALDYCLSAICACTCLPFDWLLRPFPTVSVLMEAQCQAAAIQFEDFEISGQGSLGPTIIRKNRDAFQEQRHASPSNCSGQECRGDFSAAARCSFNWLACCSSLLRAPRSLSLLSPFTEACGFPENWVSRHNQLRPVSPCCEGLLCTSTGTTERDLSKAWSLKSVLLSRGPLQSPSPRAPSWKHEPACTKRLLQACSPGIMFRSASCMYLYA